MTGTRYFAEAAYAPDPLGYWVCRAGESRQPLFLVRFSDFSVEVANVARCIAALLNCREETTHHKPLAWAGPGCERDIEERRIEESDAEEAAREEAGNG